MAITIQIQKNEGTLAERLTYNQKVKRDEIHKDKEKFEAQEIKVTESDDDPNH